MDRITVLPSRAAVRTEGTKGIVNTRSILVKTATISERELLGNFGNRAEKTPITFERNVSNTTFHEELVVSAAAVDVFVKVEVFSDVVFNLLSNAEQGT